MSRPYLDLITSTTSVHIGAYGSPNPSCRLGATWSVGRPLHWKDLAAALTLAAAGCVQRSSATRNRNERREREREREREKEREGGSDGAANEQASGRGGCAHCFPPSPTASQPFAAAAFVLIARVPAALVVLNHRFLSPFFSTRNGRNTDTASRVVCPTDGGGGAREEQQQQ